MMSTIVLIASAVALVTLSPIIIFAIILLNAKRTDRQRRRDNSFGENE